MPWTSVKMQQNWCSQSCEAVDFFELCKIHVRFHLLEAGYQATGPMRVAAQQLASLSHVSPRKVYLSA